MADLVQEYAQLEGLKSGFTRLKGLLRFPPICRFPSVPDGDVIPRRGEVTSRHFFSPDLSFFCPGPPCARPPFRRVETPPSGGPLSDWPHSRKGFSRLRRRQAGRRTDRRTEVCRGSNFVKQPSHRRADVSDPRPNYPTNRVKTRPCSHVSFRHTFFSSNESSIDFLVYKAYCIKLQTGS